MSDPTFKDWEELDAELFEAELDCELGYLCKGCKEPPRSCECGGEDA